MSSNSKISWTDHTFNPWWGCTNISPGCANCYAAAFAKRTGLGWGNSTPRRFFSDAHWQEPVKWNRTAERRGNPAFVFCASMADVFEDAPDHAAKQTNEARERLFRLIESTPWLIWLLLTKRPENARVMVPLTWLDGKWPVNAWVGTTTEDQQRADERLPHLLALPASRRFVSVEPALEQVDLASYLAMVGYECPECGDAGCASSKVRYCGECAGDTGRDVILKHSGRRLDWVIIGGESGPKARPFNVAWAEETVRQCRAAGVMLFVKQLGANPVASRAGLPPWPLFVTDKSGANPAEWPEHLRIQERPMPLEAKREQ